MSLTRREWAALLPMLAAAQSTEPNPKPTKLPTRIYHSDQIPYKGDETKKARRFLYGSEHSGFNLEVHETILGPGVETHPPHRHVHDELMIVVEGTLEMNFDGRKERAEAGSVIHSGSNEMHNARNAGSGPCRYYVIEMRGQEA